MAYTQADLDNAKACRASGVRSMAFSDGRNVSYVTDNEWVNIIADIQRDINASVGRRPVRRYLISPSGGF